MYTTINFKTKKELKEALATGLKVGVYQPNDISNQTMKVQVGEHEVSLEGPWYPKPHTWYAQAKVVNGQIVSIK